MDIASGSYGRVGGMIDTVLFNVQGEVEQSKSTLQERTPVYPTKYPSTGALFD